MLIYFNVLEWIQCSYVFILWQSLAGLPAESLSRRGWAFSSKFRRRNQRCMASILLRRASWMNFDCSNLHQRPMKREWSVFRRTDFTVKTVLWIYQKLLCLVQLQYAIVIYRGFHAFTHMDGLKTSKAMPAILGLDSCSGFCKISVRGSDTVSCLIVCPTWGHGECARQESSTQKFGCNGIAHVSTWTDPGDSWLEKMSFKINCWSLLRQAAGILGQSNWTEEEQVGYWEEQVEDARITSLKNIYMYLYCYDFLRRVW